MINLTKGKEKHVILKFAMPMLLGNLFQQMYNVVDSIIVGKYLGEGALAAVGSSFPIIFALIAFIIGIGGGASVVISQYFGARKLQKVKNAIDTTLIVLISASILVSIAGLLGSKYILKFIQLPDELLPLADTYLKVYLSGMLLFFGYNGISSILRGLGDSKTPLYFLIISTVINVLLDLLFIVVLKIGIQGAALATLIAQGGAFISAIIYLNRKHSIVHITLKNISFDKEIFFQSIRIGFPSGIQHTFVAIGAIALYSIVNPFGTDVIAGYTAAMRIDSLASLPAVNFSAALTTFVGQNIGAGLIKRVRKGLLSVILIGSITSIIVSIVVIFFGENLIQLFVDKKEVVEIGSQYLLIVCSFYLIFSSMFIINGLLRGAGATLVPMFITLFSLWGTRIPLAYFLSKEYGPTGIWYSIPMAWFIGLIGSFAYYKFGNWQKHTVIKDK